MLVTTSRKPSVLTKRLGRALACFIPFGRYDNRGKSGIEELAAKARVLGKRLLFTDQAVRNHRDTLGADTAKRNALDMGLLGRGIFVKPGTPFYLSTAHDERAVRETLGAFEEAVPAIT